MATAVAVAPGAAVLSPKVGGAVLVSVIGDAHILTTPIAPPASTDAVVGSAVVGTSTVAPQVIAAADSAVADLATAG